MKLWKVSRSKFWMQSFQAFATELFPSRRMNLVYSIWQRATKRGECLEGWCLPWCFSDKEPSNLDLSSQRGQEDEIARLAEVCQPATFGFGDQDVFDETYRKAWKMDVSQFSAQFDLARSGIMELVHDQLLGYEDRGSMTLVPHLYKLNIYGRD